VLAHEVAVHPGALSRLAPTRSSSVRLPPESRHWQVSGRNRRMTSISHMRMQCIIAIAQVERSGRSGVDQRGRGSSQAGGTIFSDASSCMCDPLHPNHEVGVFTTGSLRSGVKPKGGLASLQACEIDWSSGSIGTECRCDLRTFQPPWSSGPWIATGMVVRLRR